jgi:hypothetical protein
MRARTRHYRPNPNRREPLRFGILFAAILILLLEHQPLEPPDEDHRIAKFQGPSASYALRQKRLLKAKSRTTAPATAPRDQSTKGPHRRSERVLVALQSSVDGLLMTSRSAVLDPSTFWPLPDEVPFPEGHAAPELQDLIQNQAEPGSTEERAWLDVAWEEDLAPDTVDISEDPWAGVLAMEAARRASRMEHLDLYHESLEAGLGPERGMITPRALVGPPNVDDLLALADELIDVYPEHAASEFARLYVLRATALRGSQQDITEAWQTAQDLLRHTDDTLVLGQAVGLLSSLQSDETLSGDDLDRIAEVLTEDDDLVDPIDVSVFALNQALKQEDGYRSRQWATRFETYLDAFCQVEHQSPRCDQHRDNLDLAVAYIGDLTTADATTWRQAFHIAGYSCARAGYLDPGQRLEVKVGWESDHWNFQSWRPLRTLLATCIENEMALGPHPGDEPFDVHLTVLLPR